MLTPRQGYALIHPRQKPVAVHTVLAARVACVPLVRSAQVAFACGQGPATGLRPRSRVLSQLAPRPVLPPVVQAGMCLLARRSVVLRTCRARTFAAHVRQSTTRPARVPVAPALFLHRCGNGFKA